MSQVSRTTLPLPPAKRGVVHRLRATSEFRQWRIRKVSRVDLTPREAVITRNVATTLSSLRDQARFLQPEEWRIIRKIREIPRCRCDGRDSREHLSPSVLSAQPCISQRFSIFAQVRAYNFSPNLGSRAKREL